MSNIFEVSSLSLDNIIHILYGTGVPGNSQETNDAPIGSVYFDTDGVTWKKTSAGSGTNRWAEDSVVSGITRFSGVNGTIILDSLNATEVPTGVWAVTVTRSANTADKQTAIISGSHNGTIAKYNIFGKMILGDKIDSLNYEVKLVASNLELRVAVPVNCDIECYRLNGISKGSTVTLGGTGGGGGGTGDVTTAQLNAEIANRQAGYDALDTKINTKADITGVVAQFNSVNTSLTNLSNALTSVSNNLNSEITNRQTGDTNLQSAIDALGGGGTTTTINNQDFIVSSVGIPVASAILGLYVSPKDFSLKNSGVAKVLVAPTATTVFQVLKNATNIGTVTFNAGSTTGVIAITPQSIVSGDELLITAPANVDATLSDIAITIEGSNAASQVNSDWNATSGVAQILNKPVVPTKVSDLTNDSGFQTASQVATSIASETTARTTAVSTVATNLETEITIRAAQNTATNASILLVSENLDTEVQTRTTEVATLTNNLNTLAATVSGLSTPSVPFELNINVFGKPVANAVVGMYTATKAGNITGNGVASAGLAATASSVYTVLLNNVSIGTITFDAGSTTGVFSMAPTAIARGDRLEVKSPATVDTTLSNVAISII